MTRPALFRLVNGYKSIVPPRRKITNELRLQTLIMRHRMGWHSRYVHNCPACFSERRQA